MSVLRVSLFIPNDRLYKILIVWDIGQSHGVKILYQGPCDGTADPEGKHIVCDLCCLMFGNRFHHIGQQFPVVPQGTSPARPPCALLIEDEVEYAFRPQFLQQDLRV